MTRKTDIKLTQEQIDGIKTLKITPEILAATYNTHKRNILYHLRKLQDPEIRSALRTLQCHNAIKEHIKEKAMKMFAENTGTNTQIAEALGISRSAVYTLRQLYLKEHGGEYKSKECKPLKKNTVYKWFAVSPVPMRYTESLA